jgi:hypothetical protein
MLKAKICLFFAAYSLPETDGRRKEQKANPT